MNDSRNYAAVEDPRANRPASPTASNLNQQILEAIDCAGGDFRPDRLAIAGVSLSDIKGHMHAMINLKLIEIKDQGGAACFILTQAGKSALANRLLAID